MRHIRVIAIILFIASLGAYMGLDYYKSQTSDNTKPVLTSETDELKLSVNDGEEHLTDGLTATDDKDGDLTADIMVSGKSLFTEPGTATIKYVVFDKDNNFATLTRPVVYTDYHSPEFALTDPLVFSRGTSVDYLSYITATDQLDGDLTDKIKIVSSDINTSELGVYPITLEVTNSYGDTSTVDLNVLIQERNSEASIKLTGYLTYLNVGSSFSALDYIDYITTADGEKRTVSWSEKKEEIRAYDDDDDYYCTIHVNGEVDTSTPGTYQVSYTYETDDSEAIAYQTVVVRE